MIAKAPGVRSGTWAMAVLLLLPFFAGRVGAETNTAAMNLSVRVTIVNPGDLWKADLDGDGIPDYWEILHFGGTGIVDAESDFDGDGFSDRSEYIAGTNPRDPDSLLQIADLAFLSDGSVAITWESTTVVEPAPRLYEVFSTDALETWPEGRVILRQNVSSAGMETTITNEPQFPGLQFFGIGVRIQE